MQLAINMTPRRNGTTSFDTRRVERGLQVCWSNYSWYGPAKHPHSFFLHHVHDPGCIPECSFFAGVLALRGPARDATFPAPLFRLKQRAAALRWMRARNLTSTCAAAYAAPLAIYRRANLSAAVVAGVRQHPAIFGLREPRPRLRYGAALRGPVAIGVGMVGRLPARRVIYYAKQAGGDSDGYVEADRMPPHWLSF